MEVYILFEIKVRKFTKKVCQKGATSKLRNQGNNSESPCQVFLVNVLPLNPEKKLPRTTHFATNKLVVVGGEGVGVGDIHFS